jgi:hypothetical protein
VAEERTFTRQEFFDLVWSTPMQQLAKQFKLSDVGLAKTCKRFNIPRPERGHWQKVAVGKAPKRPSLPASPNGVEQIRFYVPDDPVPQPEPVISPEVAGWIEREHDPANKIVVTQSVSKYHPLVRAAKAVLEQKRMYGYGAIDDGWRFSGRDNISVRVTRPLIGRACRVLNALLAALEKRKFSISRQPGEEHPVITVLGETFTITLDERNKRIAHTATREEVDREKRGLGKPRKYDDVPSGRLRLTIEHQWRKTSFEDTDTQLLDDQLNDVILYLVRTVIEVLRPERIAREEAAQKRREEEHERWLFQQRCDRFDDAYRAWSAQQERLRFVSVLEATLAKLENPSDALRDYVAWTRRYVEWADPLPKFFAALAEDKTASYHPFTRERYGRF